MRSRQGCFPIDSGRHGTGKGDKPEALSWTGANTGRRKGVKEPKEGWRGQELPSRLVIETRTGPQ